MVSRLLASFLLLCFIADPVSADPISFKGQIAPLLWSQCAACHGPKKAEGGFRVDNFERAMAAGDSTQTPFAAGKPDDAEALRRLTTTDKKERMPKDADPLPAEQIALVKQWIVEGSKFDGSDPKAPLPAIIPPPKHPPAPEAYPRPLAITALAFSADGTQLFAGGYHEITVWNPLDGQLIKRIGNIGQRTYKLALSPDGKTLAAAGGAPGRLGEVRLIDLESGEVKQVLASAGDVVLDVAWDAKGEQIATAGSDNTVRVYAPDGMLKTSFDSHSDWVTAVAFSPDGKKLATASRDKTAKVFDLEAGKPLVTYSGHNAPVRGVAFAANGEEVFSSANDQKVHRWKLAEGKKSADTGSFGDEVYGLAVAGEHFFAPSADKVVKQYQLSDGKEVKSYPDHPTWALTAAGHPGTQRLAVGTFDGQVTVWNTADGKQVVRFLAAPGLK
jgi:DNA-binding beta-propeller fold protein YncE